MWYRSGEDFMIVDSTRDERGWLVSIAGLHGVYEDLSLGIHGRHQVTHLATAIAACEAFFGRALDPDAVREAAATVRSPGRLEVAGLDPTILIDGAHNEEGFHGLGTALTEEFDEEDWTLVLGIRGDRDVAALLAPLRGLISRIIATQAADHLAVDANQVANAAAASLDAPAEIVPTVSAAVDKAISETVPPSGVVIAGSLYVVGEARHALSLDNSPSPVHRRFEAPIEE
jgi:dihydrofolate synthase/folylpolyglutamate synthase